jgi:hypothetical protein
MATVLAPDGHQQGGCDYVGFVLHKWTNRHCLNEAAEVDYHRPLSFVFLSSSLYIFFFLSFALSFRPFLFPYVFLALFLFSLSSFPFLIYSISLFLFALFFFLR